jgi:anti-sigma-K factor RskA
VVVVVVVVAVVVVVVVVVAVMVVVADHDTPAVNMVRNQTYGVDCAKDLAPCSNTVSLEQSTDTLTRPV